MHTDIIMHAFAYVVVVAVSFIGGGKPPTCRKSLTNFIT
jgi:hypothetical protein